MRHRQKLKPIYACVLFALASPTVMANPLDPTVVSGQASFATAGSTLTVTNTPGAIINWQGFSIGANEITRFAQQSASSAVLNRVISSNPSSILGTLQSNGRVFLINPNGIVFGAGSVVNVAGLVASTLNLSDADFLAGRDHYTQVPGAANISNAGDISAQDGGQIFLIAPNVENTGVITAPNGEILLVAGHSVDLVSTSDPNLRVNITAPAGDATNVGQLIASSGSLGLFGTVVRNSGAVSADSATLQGGKIVFRSSHRTEISGTASASGKGGGEIKVLSDMQTGTVSVSGTLDASAPVSGNGGFIDTSAAHVHVTDTARISASATSGKAGEWLIDPLNVIISATTIDGGGTFIGGVWTPTSSGSFISSGTIQGALNGGTSVTITTVNPALEAGDINVNTSIAKTLGGAASLTLLAENNINFANGVGVSSTVGALNLVLHSDSDGSGAGTVVFAGGNTFSLLGGRADLYYNPVSYTDAATRSDNLGNPYSPIFGAIPHTAWMLVNDVNQLQAMNTTLSGKYALGKNIDATGTSTWNTGAGFVPVGANATEFTGMFDGQGRTINGLFIYRPSTDYVGLFGRTQGSTIKAVSLTNVNISGNSYVGSLVGWHQGNLANSNNATGTVTGTMDAASLTGNYIGGLVGINYNNSTIDTCISGSTVSGDNYVGGLVGGSQQSTISNSGASGTVTGTQSNVGGLAGGLDGDFSPHSLTNGTASGNVSGGSNVGGLVGWSGYLSTITIGIASGNVVSTGTDPYNSGTGGLVGMNAYNITGSHATGSVTGVTNVGGLVGNNYYDNNPSFSITWGSISNSDATGTVTGTTNVGGLVGINNNTSTTINTSNAGGAVSGLTNVGGLVGYNYRGAISTSFATGAVTPSGANSVSIGGLVGENTGTITNSYVTTTSVLGYMNVGGLVGFNHVGTGCCYPNNITNSYVSGGSVTGTSNVGGLVGNNTGTLTNSHYNITGVTVNGANIVTLGGLYNDNTANLQGLGQYNDWLLGKALNIADYTAVNGGSFVTLGINSYAINDIQGMKDLLGFADNPAYTFTLTGNIDLSLNVNLSPLPGFYVPELAGTFDGASVAGFITISNLNLNILNSNLGLFGRNSGIVSNVALVDASITGGDNVGALAGWNLGAINSSSVSTTLNGSTVSGGTNVGGLVGNNSGAIYTSSFSANSGGTASVTGTTNVGGLVGAHSALFLNDSGVSVISSGVVTVSGVSNVGGLVGNLTGNIDGDYVSSATITATGQNIGGLAGSILNSPLNSHFNVDAVTTNGVNNVTRGGLYAGQYSAWFGGARTPLVIGSYSTSLVLQPLDGSYGISDLQGMKDMLAFAEDSLISFSLLDIIDLGALPGFNVPILAGSFNGNNFSISNLSINLPNSDMGLFGNINFNSSVVSNLALVNANVTGVDNVGVLAGTNYGTIDNVNVSGTVAVTGAGSNVGGLVGYNSYGNISNSSVSGVAPDGSDVAVSGAGYVGGLVGYNQGSGSYYSSSSSYASGSGIISNSFVSNGSVTGTSGNIGGLVGYNSRGEITGSHVSNADVNGGSSNSVGGLVGGNFGSASSSSSSAYFNGGFISNSYVSGGTVTSTGNDVGGLVGNNYGALVNRSHVDTVVVSGNLNVGGLVGNDSGEGGCCLPTVGAVWNSHAVNTQVTGWSNVGGLVGYVGLAPTMTSGGPSVYANVLNSYVSGGTVTSNASTTLASAIGGLVGYNSLGNINGSYVTGTGINGGLASDVGGLVGYNIGSATGSSSSATRYGVIANSYVSGGTVSGKANVGGLVGYNIGSINDSYVKGSAITGTVSVGGLVGNNGIAAPTSTSGSSSVSGSTFAANISNSYISGGTVSGSTNVGGVIGYNDGTVSNTFWDTALATGSLTNGIGYDLVIDVPSDSGASPLDATGMMTMANFAAAGWDIADTGGMGATWRIYEGYTTPLLTSFLTPLEITADAVSKSYDGNPYSGGLVNPVYNPASPDPAHILGSDYSANDINAGTYAPALYSDQQGYDISYVGGMLTIGTASLSVISLNGTRFYDGTLDVAASIFTLSGLVSGQDLNLTGVGTIANPNVGTYSVTLGSLALGDGVYGLASNYTLAGGTHTATITAAPLTITGTNVASKVYDGTTSATVGAGGLSGLMPAETLLVSASGVFADKNAGPAKNVSVTYTLSNDTGLASNYSLAGETLTADITARGVTVTADAAQTKVYGNPDALTYTAVGLAPGDTKATVFSGALSRAPGENVTGSPYAITQGNLAANANYSYIPATDFIPGGTLTITPALLTVAANATNKILNTTDPLLTYMVSGLKLSDTAATTLTGELSRAAGETVGTYQIDQGTLGLNTTNFASTNYTMNYVSANFTILVPTVIDEIVNTSLMFGPDTGSARSTSSNEEDKAKEEILANLDIKPVDGTAGQPLPVCN